MTADEPLLTMRDALLRPGGSTRVRGVDLVVRRGEIVALRGESGSGKTTVLRAVAGLIPVVGGEFSLRAERVTMMFQEPRLLPWRSVVDNVLFALGAPPDEGQVERAVGLLDRLGLGHVRNAAPATLSGGMRHRAGIARALMVEADLLLADEPFAHLDEGWAGTVAELLVERAAAGTAILLAAHETELVDRIAGRVYGAGAARR